jgi:hypothetical protein
MRASSAAGYASVIMLSTLALLAAAAIPSGDVPPVLPESRPALRPEAAPPALGIQDPGWKLLGAIGGVALGLSAGGLLADTGAVPDLRGSGVGLGAALGLGAGLGLAGLVLGVAAQGGNEGAANVVEFIDGLAAATTAVYFAHLAADGLIHLLGAGFPNPSAG